MADLIPVQLYSTDEDGDSTKSTLYGLATMGDIDEGTGLDDNVLEDLVAAWMGVSAAEIKKVAKITSSSPSLGEVHTGNAYDIADKLEQAFRLASGLTMTLVIPAPLEDLFGDSDNAINSQTQVAALIDASVGFIGLASGDLAAAPGQGKRIRTSRRGA